MSAPHKILSPLEINNNCDYRNIKWALQAICRSPHITTREVVGNIGVSETLCGPNQLAHACYPDTSSTSIADVVNGSHFRLDTVHYATILTVNGCEYLLLHLINNVHAVLSGSQVLEAVWA